MSRKHLLSCCFQKDLYSPYTDKLVLESHFIFLTMAYAVVGVVSSLCIMPPEHYRWPLIQKKKQKQRQKLCDLPPKQSLIDSSAFDTVAVHPTVNFAVDCEEHYVYYNANTTARSRGSTC